MLVSLRMGEEKFSSLFMQSAHLFLHGKEHTWKQVHLRAKAGEGTANKGDMAHISGEFYLILNQVQIIPNP